MKATKMRFIPLLLATLLLISSCNTSSQQSDSVTTAPSTDAVTEAPVEETVNYLEIIPTYDLEGSDFRIACQTADDRPNIHSGEQNGDIVNDALYLRDMAAEERFKTKIVNTTFANRANINKEINRMVTADEDSYDIIITSLLDGIGGMAAGGLLADLSVVDTLDFSQPWWNQNAQDALSWNNKIYGGAGPIALCYCYAPYALFVNLTMADDYRIGNLYETVDSGDWTIDYMNDVMKNIAEDVDGDGKYTVEDRCGLAMTLESGNAFLTGCGQLTADKNGDEVAFRFNDLKFMEVLDKLNSVFSQQSSILTDFLGNNVEGAAHLSYKVRMFTNSQALFNAAPLVTSVYSFREMEDDYGLLPYPKLDKAQQEYYSYLLTFHPNAVAVPKTNTRIDETGAVMEFMCYYGEMNVRPQIHSVVLKEKIARDEDSKRMFDLMFKNVVFDVNHVFSFGGSTTVIREYASGHTQNIVSKWASIEEKVLNELAETIEKLTA